MPAERRQFTATRPVKTERTHEENQERAYIAASRRSDRSLEARIESARRASEIHKRRTGRGLRVTEQDVINEEMYEEEDDDLPTQYLRLNAHLQTSSVMFNKKLHDYIATQHGVRNMFMSQYQSPPFQQAAVGGQHIGPGSMQPIQANNWLNPAMPSQQFNPSMQPEYQQPQSYTPTAGQQQGFRQSPYYIPQRQPPHQRSLSIQMPPAANFDSVSQRINSGTSTPHGDITRRMSLPPHAFQQQAANQVEAKSQQTSLSQSPVQRQLSTTPQSVSPRAGSVYASPATQNDASTPSLSYSPGIFPFTSQVLNSTPLTMSLPPESQQFIGSVLDPNDPRTAAFMSGSENVPQPFTSTSTYNHNVKPEIATVTKNVEKAAGSTLTLSSGLALNLDGGSDKISTGLTSISDGFLNNDSFLTPGNGDYNAFFDFQNNDHFYNGEDFGGAPDQLDGNSFINWD